MFADLHAHDTDTGAAALDQDRLAGLEFTVGDDGVMHGQEGRGNRAALDEIHMVRHGQGPAVIGGRIFGPAARTDSHHPVADRDAAGLRTRLDDLAAERRTHDLRRAADMAVILALGGQQVRAVHAAAGDLDDHLRRLHLGPVDLGDLNAVFGEHDGLHLVVGHGFAFSPVPLNWRGDLF